MAGSAAAGDAGMVEGRRCPRRGGVAVAARVATGNVRRCFALGDYAVVACAADTDDLRVIDRISGSPHRCFMAGLTGISRIDVGDVLAGCLHAVVAGGAVSGDATVVEARRDPCAGSMTVVAGLTTGYMGRRLADRGRAIVTGTARAGECCMIHISGEEPGRCIVAVRTFAARIDVIDRLPGCMYES